MTPTPTTEELDEERARLVRQRGAIVARMDALPDGHAAERARLQDAYDDLGRRITRLEGQIVDAHDAEREAERIADEPLTRAAQRAVASLANELIAHVDGAGYGRERADVLDAIAERLRRHAADARHPGRVDG